MMMQLIYISNWIETVSKSSTVSELNRWWTGMYAGTCFIYMFSFCVREQLNESNKEPYAYSGSDAGSWWPGVNRKGVYIWPEAIKVSLSSSNTFILFLAINASTQWWTITHQRSWEGDHPYARQTVWHFTNTLTLTSCCWRTSCARVILLCTRVTTAVAQGQQQHVERFNSRRRADIYGAMRSTNNLHYYKTIEDSEANTHHDGGSVLRSSSSKGPD